MKIKALSDLEKSSAKRVENEGIFETKLRSRDRYLLERDRIKQQIGDLEQIREKLGLSQRRACQLLLVDPSAWTRWNKTEAPPHIYQALRWLIELKKVNPEAAGPIDLTTRLDQVQASTQTKIKQLEQNVALLERTVSMAPATPVQTHASFDESMIQSALAAQEERFQRRILELENRIQGLMSQKSKRRAVTRSRVRRSKQKKSGKTARTRKPAQKSAKIAKRNRTSTKSRKKRRGR